MQVRLTNAALIGKMGEQANYMRNVGDDFLSMDPPMEETARDYHEAADLLVEAGIRLAAADDIVWKGGEA